MCCRRLYIFLGQGNISKIRRLPKKTFSTRCKLYTYTSTNGKWTFHACSSTNLTVKFKVQTLKKFQEIVLLQMLSWPWPVYCSWSLWLLLYYQILNSQTFRSASGRSLPHSNWRPPQSLPSLRPHHSPGLIPPFHWLIPPSGWGWNQSMIGPQLLFFGLCGDASRGGSIINGVYPV